MGMSAVPTSEMEKLTVDEEKSKAKKKAAETQQRKVAELKPPPNFLDARIAIWNRCKAERDDWLAKQERRNIKIQLHRGNGNDHGCAQAPVVSPASELVDHVAVYSRPLQALGGESALHLNLQFRGGVLGSLP